MEPKAPGANCSECPLKDEKGVPTKIPLGVPRLAVVGEAPGFQETVYGEPFKGPSGQLLNRVLEYVGYDKSEVMYTNVCLCRPPDNATPPAAAQNACRGRLIHELRESGVRDVLALGGTAVGALVDDPRTITALRVGPPKLPTVPLRGSVERVIPTWHPAYCLRNADAFPTMVGDIEKLNRLTLDSWQEPDWHYYDEPLMAVQFLDFLWTWQRYTGNYELVLDIEVGIEKDTAFDHPNMYQMLCVGLAWAKGEAAVIGEEAMKNAQVRGRLDRILRRSKLIAQNGKFDLAGLWPIFPGLSLWFDTMLAHYALDERSGGHGLKILAVERLGAPAYDDEIKKYIPRGGNYANIPRPILYKYNAFDVACTWDLYELFTLEMEAMQTPAEWPYPELPVRTLRDWHDFLVAASNQLMFLELNGITVDIDYNTELSFAYIKKLDAMEEALNAIVREATRGSLEGINPRSPKQVKEFYLTEGIRLAGTDKDVLAGLMEKLDEDSPAGRFTAGLLEHRFETKRYGTFVKGIRQRLYGRRVFTNYLLHGTTSGRLASRNPNLQNIVRDKAIRRQFVASKPGNILIQADYKQAEGRVIAWLARDTYLRDIFASQVDLFNMLGSGLYKCTLDELNDGSALAKERRVRTKAFFYGIGFGREYYSIAKEYKLPLDEAERDYYAFLETIPDTVRWQTSIKNHVLAGKDLVSPFGRRRRFSLITKQNQKDVFNEALSYLPQSIASDICLTALQRLRPKLRGIGFIRLTIHDALVVEAPEARLEVVSHMLRTEMVQAAAEITTYVPFEVDVSYGHSWGDL
jgi:uracil-DNA glycosylase family 4